MLLRHVALAKKYFNANIAAELKRQPKYADELPLLAAPTAAPEEIAKREGEPEL